MENLEVGTDGTLEGCWNVNLAQVLDQVSVAEKEANQEEKRAGQGSAEYRGSPGPGGRDSQQPF